jgi:anti-sigma B factor antagonist
MARRMKITERRVGDVTILELHGRLVMDEDTSCTELIDDLVRQGRIRLILNLRDVSYIDSAGVGALIAKYVSLRRRGGDLRLVSLSDRVRRVITIARLLDVFDTFESEDLAVRSFSVLHHTVL